MENLGRRKTTEDFWKSFNKIIFGASPEHSSLQSFLESFRKQGEQYSFMLNLFAEFTKSDKVGLTHCLFLDEFSVALQNRILREDIYGLLRLAASGEFPALRAIVGVGTYLLKTLSYTPPVSESTSSEDIRMLPPVSWSEGDARSPLNKVQRLELECFTLSQFSVLLIQFKEQEDLKIDSLIEANIYHYTGGSPGLVTCVLRHIQQCGHRLITDAVWYKVFAKGLPKLISLT